MRISDWSSDVCSSDLKAFADRRALGGQVDHAGHHHDAAVAHEGHPALLHEAGALGREKAAEQESLHIGAPERRGDLGTGKAVAEAVLCAVIDEEYPAESPGNTRGNDITEQRHIEADPPRAPITKQTQQVQIGSTQGRERQWKQVELQGGEGDEKE